MDKDKKTMLIYNFVGWAGGGALLGALFYKKNRKKGALVGAGIGTVVMVGILYALAGLGD